MRGMIVALLVLASGAVHALELCPRYVLTGIALHADRETHYRTLTTGGGCEWAWKDLRAGGTLFLNSNTHRTFLIGGGWLPAHAGAWSAGVAFGDAMFGYDKLHQLAGGLVVERMGPVYGGDLFVIPRVDGIKGVVSWLRFKCVRARCEPLK